jgi:two-component system, chemotaxis family, CheB/CheR fusion protein
LADNSFTHLVAVGSSAGGIGALSGLVSSLPDDFDAPIVVAQHLDPNRESHLKEILARKSPLPVKTVTEHEPLQAGVVFVVPSNRHVNITDSEIDLSSEPSSGQPMPSINLLMETAARVFGENLIAIVLSGTGTDGTEGARTVSQAGGTVIIQDPETAEFGEMPLAGPQHR